MIATFKGKKITGMLTVMPENEYDYEKHNGLDHNHCVDVC